MITSVRLTNFKNFADETLKLGPFTVIVGANASGKSNIRDAFRFLHGIGRGYSLAEIIGGKNRRRGTVGVGTDKGRAKRNCPKENSWSAKGKEFTLSAELELDGDSNHTRSVSRTTVVTSEVSSSRKKLCSLTMSGFSKSHQVRSAMVRRSRERKLVSFLTR